MANQVFDAPVAYDTSDGLNGARGILLMLGIMVPTLLACAVAIWWMLR